MNFYDTLIEVAEDCPVSEAHMPQARGGKKTKAVVEYELLLKHPLTDTLLGIGGVERVEEHDGTEDTHRANPLVLQPTRRCWCDRRAERTSR